MASLELPSCRGGRRRKTPMSKMLNSSTTTSMIPAGIPVTAELPKSLNIKFTNDYNILHVDSIIMAHFSRSGDELAKLTSSMDKIKSQLLEPLTLGESRSLRSKLESLQSQYDRIASGVMKSEYENESRDYIDKYLQITKAESQSLVKSYNQGKIDIIMGYFDIAKKYMDIDAVHVVDVPTNIVCKGCLRILDDCPSSNESGYQVCPNCDVVRQVNINGRSGDTANEVSNTKEYSDLKNFRKAMQRYQGQQKVTFDIDAICNEIDLYLQSRGYKPASYYKDLPPDKYGKKKGTDLNLIEESLEAIKHTSLYESSNLIGHHLWGWVLPSLQKIENIIINDYKETQDVFDSLPIEIRERESCLSTQLRLYRHVQLCDYPCRQCDFKLPSQRESLRKQDAIWKIMCDTCNKRNPRIRYIPM